MLAFCVHANLEKSILYTLALSQCCMYVLKNYVADCFLYSCYLSLWNCINTVGRIWIWVTLILLVFSSQVSSSPSQRSSFCGVRERSWFVLQSRRKETKQVSAPGGGKNSLIWKGLGCAWEIFNRTLKRYQDFVGVAWILSPLKRYYLNNSVFPKKYRKTSRQEIPKTLSWPLKRTTSTTVLFVWKPPPGVSGLQYGNYLTVRHR